MTEKQTKTTINDEFLYQRMKRENAHYYQKGICDGCLVKDTPTWRMEVNEVPYVLYLCRKCTIARGEK